MGPGRFPGSSQRRGSGIVSGEFYGHFDRFRRRQWYNGDIRGCLTSFCISIFFDPNRSLRLRAVPNVMHNNNGITGDSGTYHVVLRASQVGSQNPLKDFNGLQGRLTETDILQNCSCTSCCSFWIRSLRCGTPCSLRCLMLLSR